MSASQIERVLANWIKEAQSPVGEIGRDVDPAEWAAERFIAWWRKEVEEILDEGEGAVTRFREGVGGVLNWEQHGDALHELMHVEEAFWDLRAALGFDQAPRQDS